MNKQITVTTMRGNNSEKIRYSLPFIQSITAEVESRKNAHIGYFSFRPPQQFPTEPVMPFQTVYPEDSFTSQYWYSTGRYFSAMLHGKGEYNISRTLVASGEIQALLYNPLGLLFADEVSEKLVSFTAAFKRVPNIKVNRNKFLGVSDVDITIRQLVIFELVAIVESKKFSWQTDQVISAGCVSLYSDRNSQNKQNGYTFFSKNTAIGNGIHQYEDDMEYIQSVHQSILFR